MADIKLKNTANTEFSISHNGTRGAKAVTSDQIVVAVETINDFPANAETGDTVIVKDNNRGGTFIYDATKSAINNGGTIFDGWVRQYSGAVNVKWFGADIEGIYDSSASVILALASMQIPKLVFDGDIRISQTIPITVYGATIDLTTCNLTIDGGTGFTQDIEQVINTTYYANNEPLDDEGNYFYPTTILNGRVTVTNGSSLSFVRRPFLYANSFNFHAFSISGTEILQKDDSKIFQIHGGWGHLFNGISVTGEQANSGWLGSVFQIIPDGTYFKSSHPQAISINGCKFNKLRLFYTDNGLCTNSLESLKIDNCDVAFCDFGNIKLGNYINIQSGMYVIYGDMIFTNCSQVSIVGTYLQRETGNVSPTSLQYGVVTFQGGNSSIILSDIIGVMPPSGDGIAALSGGHLISFIGGGTAEYFSIIATNIFVIRTGMTRLNEVSSGTSSVLNFVADGASVKFRNVIAENIGARSTHSIIALQGVGTSSIDKLQLSNIYAVGGEVARRVNSITKATKIKAPDMYKKLTIAIYGTADTIGTVRPIASQSVDVSQMAGTIVSTISNFVSTSNASSIVDYGGTGSRTLVLQQISGLTAGTPVNGSATVIFDSSNSSDV